MKMKRTLLTVSLLLALCVSTAHAGYRLQYQFGYGIYPFLSPDASSTESGTGLLSANGIGAVAVQLIWAGPNLTRDACVAYNAANGYVSGDDVVLETRILTRGFDGVDEWGFTHTPPPPYVTTNSLHKPVYIRVHQSVIPSSGCHRHFDSPLFFPPDMDGSASPPSDTLATLVYIETGSETMPTEGVEPYECPGCPMEDPWCIQYQPPPNRAIQPVEFDPEVVGTTCGIPSGYSVHTVYGADTVLPDGGWNWSPLVDGTQYTIEDGVVTLLTESGTLPDFQMIKITLNYAYFIPTDK